MSSQGSKWEENIEHLIQLVKRCQIPHPQTATNYDDDKCTTLGTHRKSGRWRDGLLSNVVSQLHDTLKTQKIFQVFVQVLTKDAASMERTAIRT